MKTRISFWLVLTIITLLLSVSNITVTAQEGTSGDENLSIIPQGVEVKTYVFQDGHRPAFVQHPIAGALPWTDIAVHGTLWRAELAGQFTAFKTMGWGTYAQAKAISNQWVHLPIPYVTYLEDVAQKIRYVEFCAQSSAGAVTKPIAFHLWTNATRFYAGAVNWPANNNRNCWGVSFSPGVWKEDLGISVSLHYANPAHSITLYKAWAQFER